MRKLYFSLCLFLMSFWIVTTTFAMKAPLVSLKSDSCRIFISMLSQLSNQVNQVELQLSSLNFRAFIWIALVLSAIAAIFLLIIGVIIGTYVFRKHNNNRG